MKPYQLAGLSFLVYLHRNGLSGILGDEMGLWVYPFSGFMFNGLTNYQGKDFANTVPYSVSKGDPTAL